MDSSLPGKIPDVENTTPAPAVGDKITERQGGSFQQFMETPSATQPPTGSIQNVQQKPSPMEMQQGVQAPLGTPSMDSLQTQTNQVNQNLQVVNQQLNTKNLSLNQSQKYLLRNKLTDANESVRLAASKAGVDVGPAVQTTGKLNPIAKFLNYVTDSQSQLASVQNKLKELSSEGKSLSAGQMLMIQVKLNKAQQALEYSSTLLGKAVEDIKTLFNVQI